MDDEPKILWRSAGEIKRMSEEDAVFKQTNDVLSGIDSATYLHRQRTPLERAEVHVVNVGKGIHEVAESRPVKGLMGLLGKAAENYVYNMELEKKKRR